MRLLWYDAKPLGYYDYVFGGRGGVIDGGGARVGGGMCAGKFDGGGIVRCRRPRRHRRSTIPPHFVREGVVKEEGGLMVDADAVAGESYLADIHKVT
jgi:hypothetical protein